MVCPKCGSADQLAMSDGVVLCLDCRHEHDGTQTAPTPAPNVDATETPLAGHSDTATILAAETVADVLAAGGESPPIDAPLAGDPPAADTPNLAGRFLHVRGYVDALLCVEDDGGATITCVDMDDFTRTVNRTDVAAAEMDGTDPLAPTIGATTVSEDQPYDPAIFAVASAAITQGLACIGDDGETLYNPRIGWLPPPCDQVPEAEQGVAYAIALLIVTFGLDTGSVEQIAATLMQGATTPEMEMQQ